MGLSWAFWGLLGPSLAVLGRLGVIWGRLKFDVKIDQKIDTFQDRFLTRCWWILGRKSRQVGTRIDQKSDHKLTSYQKCRTGLWYCENYYFSIEIAFWRSKHRSNIDQKSIKNRLKHEVNMGWRLFHQSFSPQFLHGSAGWRDRRSAARWICH